VSRPDDPSDVHSQPEATASRGDVTSTPAECTSEGFGSGSLLLSSLPGLGQ